jgi:hypothetical protein
MIGENDGREGRKEFCNLLEFELEPLVPRWRSWLLHWHVEQSIFYHPAAYHSNQQWPVVQNSCKDKKLVITGSVIGLI